MKRTTNLYIGRRNKIKISVWIMCMWIHNSEIWIKWFVCKEKKRKKIKPSTRKHKSSILSVRLRCGMFLKMSALLSYLTASRQFHSFLSLEATRNIRYFWRYKEETKIKIPWERWMPSFLTLYSGFGWWFLGSSEWRIIRPYAPRMT